MSEATYHHTSEDVRKLESRESKLHNGDVPAESEASMLKEKLSKQESKSEQIDRVKANLPLPEDPPTASDWNSADKRTANVGSGGVGYNPANPKASDGLREPATADSSVRTDGEEFKVNTAP